MRFSILRLWIRRSACRRFVNLCLCGRWNNRLFLRNSVFLYFGLQTHFAIKFFDKTSDLFCPFFARHSCRFNLLRNGFRFRFRRGKGASRGCFHVRPFARSTKETRYKSALSFKFDKDSLPTLDPEKIKAAISTVFATEAEAAAWWQQEAARLAPRPSMPSGTFATLQPARSSHGDF